MAKPINSYVQDSNTKNYRSKGSTRPVAGMIDKLSNMPLEELVAEKFRLETARKGNGIGPDDWYRLYAIRALMIRHEVENLQNNGRSSTKHTLTE